MPYSQKYFLKATLLSPKIRKHPPNNSIEEKKSAPYIKNGPGNPPQNPTARTRPAQPTLPLPGQPNLHRLPHRHPRLLRRLLHLAPVPRRKTPRHHPQPHRHRPRGPHSDSQARAAKTKEAVHIRIAKRGTKSYQLDLGTDDHQVVNITGQHWQLSQHFDTHFERIEDHKPIAPPEPTANTLEACMETLFHLPTQIAGKLAIWLVEAMLPERKPPILVITGKAREQAVITLRNLIDPVLEPIIETPVNANELRRMSLENKVLAFSVNDQFSEKIIKGLNQFHEGKRVLLKHCQGSRIKLRSTISRPVIIATEEPQQISPTQFNLEINEAEDIQLGKIVGALLSLLVKIIGQPEEVRETRAMAEPGEIEATREPPSPDSS